jgi:hypothetical protein
LARDRKLCTARGSGSWRCRLLHSRRLGTRAQLPRVLQRMGYSGASAEIGVWNGFYTSALLKDWRGGGPHFGIDPYMRYGSSNTGCNQTSRRGGDKQCWVTQQMFDGVHDATKQRLLRAYPGRASLIRAFSVDAAARFANASLSFVYIDARHDYEGVLEDLAAWWPKLCPGAMIAGHDWTEDLDRSTDAVARALEEFLGRQRSHSQWPSTFYVTAEHPASWFLFTRPPPCTHAERASLLSTRPD